MWLLGIQMLIVCSVAGKYWYGRATYPRVWVRVQSFDPEMPVRGRYLALTPLVDACGLPRTSDRERFERYDDKRQPIQSSAYWTWRVTTHADKGALVVTAAKESAPMDVEFHFGDDCHRVRLLPSLDLFIPDTAKLPRQEPHEEFWMEVTVPPAGPPRAIQLATSLDGKWQPLKFN